MKVKRRIAAAFLAAGLVGSTGSALAQEKRFDFGKEQYDSHCAACHGISGKGDGPFKKYLTKSPPDLTVLAKKNGGVFPMEEVSSLIDGRQELGAHGPRDMPIWGAEFKAHEGYVRARILALAEYISRLQGK